MKYALTLALLLALPAAAPAQTLADKLADLSKTTADINSRLLAVEVKQDMMMKQLNDLTAAVQSLAGGNTKGAVLPAAKTCPAGVCADCPCPPGACPVGCPANTAAPATVRYNSNGYPFTRAADGTWRPVGEGWYFHQGHQMWYQQAPVYYGGFGACADGSCGVGGPAFGGMGGGNCAGGQCGAPAARGIFRRR